MRRILLSIVLLTFAYAVYSYTSASMEYKGDTYDTYNVFVSSQGAQQVGNTSHTFTSTTPIVGLANTPLYGIIAYEIRLDDDAYRVYTDSAAAHLIPEEGQGSSFIEPGERESPNGFFDGEIYGLMQGGLSGWTTVYIKVWGEQQPK